MTRFRAFLWQYDIWQNDLKHWFYSLKAVISGLWQTYDKTDLTMPSQKLSFFFFRRFLWQKPPSPGWLTLTKSPDKSGLYLFAVIVFCFSYCSKRKLSIDFISSIYKFFSSPLGKLFFFFNSSFFFKVSFVLVFSRICWKRSNVSSNSRYNWV